MNKPNEIAAYLSTPAAIRERCQQLLELARRQELNYFRLDESKIPQAAKYVVAVTKDNYPNLDIPYHSRMRHLSAGGLDRAQIADQNLRPESPADKGRLFYEMLITSILLDAGAGAIWQFKEKSTIFVRSEGLAIASFHAIKNGLFSAESLPWVVDAAGLLKINSQTLEEAFQVTPQNPLIGVQGRVDLLNMLGKTIQENQQVFPDNRLGSFYDYVIRNTKNNQISAESVFADVLNVFRPIWPARETYHNNNLGDCWRHPQIKGYAGDDTYVPFHKLSQWMTYSLFEPLEATNIKVTNHDVMTGLPEYRNGGLFVDLEVLALRNADDSHKSHPPDSPLIVEWRALTVCLLDLLAEKIRHLLGKPPASFPLVKILEGGTWQAGRKIASTKRADGTPPIKLNSDGTVF